MPRLDDDNMVAHNLGGRFAFTGARIDNLGASEYTLVNILVDVTGSVYQFKDELRNMVVAAVQACVRSDRSDNLLVRVALFSSRFSGGVSELHGFKPLQDINPEKDYPKLETGGDTPLYDACYSGIGVMNAYAQQLADRDFLVNGITFIITDGGDNASTSTRTMVKNQAVQAISGEILESHVSVLIGINAAQYRAYLEGFQREAELTQYIDAGNADKGNLAKLAAFVSQSISSTSQALGTGGASQNISATI